MFTGLVSAVARVVSLRSGAAGAVLAVERPPAFGDVAVGESIAVSGVCLTVVPRRRPARRCLSTSRPRRSRARLSASWRRARA